MVSAQEDSPDTSSEDGSNINRISLNSYVSDNSSLFLVMGVFAALSVYVSSIPSDGVDEQFIQLGLVSSLLITGLLAIVILLSLSNQVSDEEEVISSLLHVKNIDTIVFLTLFSALFYSLFHVIAEETEILALISVAILFVATLALMLTIVTYTDSRLEPYVGNDGLRTSIAGTLIFAISYRGMGEVNEYLLEEYQLHRFQFDETITFTEAFPAIFYMVFSLLGEILPIIAFGMGFFTLLFLSDVVGDKYRRVKDLMADH